MTNSPDRSSAESHYVALPCPFCGLKPYVVGAGHSRVQCINDGCFGPSTTAEYLVDAVKQWNKRAVIPIPAQPALDIDGIAEFIGTQISWGNGAVFATEHRCECADCDKERDDVRNVLRAALAAQPQAARVGTDAVEGEIDTIVQIIHKHVGVRQRIDVDLTGVEDAARAILTTRHHRSSAASEPVQDTWFTDSTLPIMAASGDVENDRVIKLHFRRKVTDSDRKRLIEVLNAGEVALNEPQPTQVTADQAAEDVRREREAKAERDRYAKMTTAEKCAVQGDGFINDYD